MQVAGQSEAGSRLRALARRFEQRVPLKMGGDVGTDLLAQVDVIDRQVGDFLQEQHSLPGIGAYRDGNAFIQSEDRGGLRPDNFSRRQRTKVALRVPLQRPVPRPIVQERS